MSKDNQGITPDYFLDATKGTAVPSRIVPLPDSGSAVNDMVGKDRGISADVSNPPREEIETKLDKILKEVAKDSWRKGNDNLFLSIDGNLGASLIPAKQALLTLLADQQREARLEEVEAFANETRASFNRWELASYIDSRRGELKGSDKWELNGDYRP